MSRFVFALALALAAHRASAAVVEKHVHSGNDDYVITCDAGPFTADYAAETGSGVPLDGPYARQRGADKGLVHLMSQGGKSAKTYIVPHADIRTIVRVRIDSAIPERADLVFTAKDLRLVHTSIANAGIFTVSDVYRLAYRDGIDEKPLKDDADLRNELHLGLASIKLPEVTCAP